MPATLIVGSMPSSPLDWPRQLEALPVVAVLEPLPAAAPELEALPVRRMAFAGFGESLVNRTERQVLAPIVKRVRGFNEHAWWELKRQTWDYGHQLYYPAQDEFLRPAEAALGRLDAASLAILAAQYASQHPGACASIDAVRSHYAHVVVEEVVNRARVAAYRTVEW